MQVNISINSCSVDDRKLIIDSINSYNLEHVPAVINQPQTRLEYVAKDDNGIVIAGVLAVLGYWGGLEINILWVKKNFRSKSIGKQLLRHVEEEGINKGAKIAILDTFDFQAKQFYLKSGYIIFGELQDFPHGHSRYYLSKKLNPK